MGGMPVIKLSLLSRAVFALAVSFAGVSSPGISSSHAIDDLRIIAPAKPGGGWDQAARALEETIWQGLAAMPAKFKYVQSPTGT